MNVKVDPAIVWTVNNGKRKTRIVGAKIRPAGETTVFPLINLTAAASVGQELVCCHEPPVLSVNGLFTA